MDLLSTTPYLRVADIERSLRFYCDGLGFVLSDQTSDERGHVFWARLEKDGYALMICDRPSRFIEDGSHEEEHEHDAEGRHVFHGAASVQAGELNHLTYIYVQNADAAYLELRAAGVEPLTQPEDQFYGLREFLVKDPDGYYYAIAHSLPAPSR